MTRRTKGSGSLIDLNGIWAMRWYQDGRRVQERTPYKVSVKADRKKAEALLAERTAINRLQSQDDQLAVLIKRREGIQERLARLQAEAMPETRTLLLGGLEAVWRDSPRRRDCSPSQLERYGQQIRAFVDWAGAHRDIRTVDDATAEEYAAYLAKTRGPNTTNKHINTLTAVWKAIGKSRGLSNPWADLPRRRLDTHVRRALTADEIKAILAAAEGEYKGLITIGYRTGLRMGDACRLKWSDFKKDGTLVVETSKTGALVALPAKTLLDELKAILGKPQGEYVLPEIAARYARDPAGVSDWVCRYFARAGLTTKVKESGWSKARPDATYHSLRHTFVTRLTEAGVPSAVVRSLVGHSTIQMQEHYTHVASGFVVDALKSAGIE